MKWKTEMLIDTHAHLDMKDFRHDLVDVLDRAIENGLTHIISVGVDLESSLNSLELANKYDFIYSSIGYHPHYADELSTEKLEKVSALASESKVVAWGEIGLDYFRNYSPRTKQIEAFEHQMENAVKCNLPVIIHDRNAHGELFDIVKKYYKNDNEPKGVIHCFSGDYDLAMSFIEMGYYISIPGTVTYNNAKNVQDVASKIPLDYLLIETDSPYLAPMPARGKRNEPYLVGQTARKIAQLRAMDFEEISWKTSENAKRLFRLD
jgi:TatD DNase family protein